MFGLGLQSLVYITQIKMFWREAQICMLPPLSERCGLALKPNDRTH